MDVISPSVDRRVRSAFHAFVEESDYPCLGARAALRHGGYRLGVYGPMCSEAATQKLSLDIRSFLDAPESGQDFATFVSIFIDVAPEREDIFESKLWRQLGMLHSLDPSPIWDPTVSPDPANPRFSFSFGETAFFVVGLHPESSRVARRFEWPTLVFNPHAQFQRMRTTG
jgi:FPC/CPF motif-containing protein YcgG